jgi:hypothetical protein
MKKSIGILALLSAGALAGCNNGGSSSSAGAAPNAAKPVDAPKATPSVTDSMKVKSGAAPLSYLVGPGGPLHIVDATAGKTVAKVTAAPNAIIAIDETKGIWIANKLVVAGPLPAGHQYEIWLDH